jgi:rhodanese-related sulfurtransferase
LNNGGKNVAMQKFLNQVVFYFSTDDEIILYCPKGLRSNQAVYHCCVDFKNAVNLQRGNEYLAKKYPHIFNVT